VHRVGPRLFDIGGRLSPASIRDQMVRAILLVDRACERGFLSRDKELLVVGAGAAGATAAMRAVDRWGIPTLLVERNRGPFRRQAECASRWIDPTQYDWPADHWHIGSFPPWRPDVPLPWDAGHADYLAGRWTTTLDAFTAVHSDLLRVEFGAVVRRVAETAVNEKLEVDLRLVTGDLRHAFSLVVSCAGPGEERCSVSVEADTFSGIPFWDTDDFLRADLGIQQVAAPRILVGGGGDGALQDFIRIASGYPSPKDLYHDLKDAAPNVDWRSIEHKLYSGEDHASRTYIWGQAKQHDHSNHQRVHDMHAAAVQTLIDTPHWQSICDKLDQKLGRRNGRVTLVFPCSHFSRVYAFNRFLVLLLARYFAARKAWTVLHPGFKVSRVAAVAPTHQCGTARRCYGEPHRVAVRAASCESERAAQGPLGEFDVVVLRGGVEGESDSAAAGVTLHRQLLPYHVSE
jgi:hypothetical protein